MSIMGNSGKCGLIDIAFLEHYMCCFYLVVIYRIYVIFIFSVGVSDSASGHPSSPGHCRRRI